mgnify:CR=1 FL=1
MSVRALEPSIGNPQIANIVSHAPSTDDLPAVTVVEITEPTAVNAGIELYDLEAVQLQSVPLRARRVVVRLGSATVVFHSTNLRIRTRTSIAPGLLAYVAFGPHTQGSVNGVSIRSGMMLSAAPGSEAAFVAEAGYERGAKAIARKQHVRLIDRSTMEAEFLALELPVAAKIIGMARKRAAEAAPAAA